MLGNDEKQEEIIKVDLNQLQKEEHNELNTETGSMGTQAVYVDHLQMPGKPKKMQIFKERMKDGFFNFIEIFKEYPITIACIIIATLLAAIIYDMDSENAAYENIIKIIIFLSIFAAGSLFTEEIFRHRYLSISRLGVSEHWCIKGAVLAVFAGITRFFQYSIIHADELIFGMTTEAQVDRFMEYLERYFVCYIAILVIMAMYLMYRRLDTSFERYCIDVFSTLIKTTVVYALFALGIAAIIEIFNILIIDTYEFDVIARLEIFLAGGIYGPAIIMVISRKREEIGKFAKVVVEYVLLPILMAAFVIIYLYLLKLLISLDMPNNEVFSILAWLFAAGLPIWTMASYFDHQVLGKIARFLPFVFIPFVILQIVCLGMRVGDYGITQSRYMGIVLIILEIIYIGIYAYKLGKFANYIIPITLVILLFVLVVPGTNLFAAVTNSQAKRMEVYLEKGIENLTFEEKKNLQSMYREIHWDGGIEGDDYLEAKFTEDERNMIDDWNFYYMNEEGEQEVWTYYSDYDNLYALDIDGYTKMEKVSDNIYSDDEVDPTHFPLRVGDYYDENIITVNISEIIYDVIKYDEHFLDDKNMYDVGDGKYLYVTTISFEINEKEEYQYFNLEGYIFY